MSAVDGCQPGHAATNVAALVSVVLGAVLAIVAVAALHSELPSNPWHQTLRRYFTQLQAPA